MSMKLMQLTSMRIGFWAFTLVAIASFGGVLTACSTTPQTQNTPATDAGGKQAQTTSATDAGNKQDMQHGTGMDHGSGMNHSTAMDLGPADANYDLRFINAMTLHHQGAVEMAKEAQQKSTRPQIKTLANDIIKAQNKEISQLKQWRQAWYPNAGDKPMAHNAQTGQMMEMSSDQMKEMMMSGDLGAANTEFDLRFINAMIPHHQGAITMAQDALSKSKRPEIKQLAQEIITSQQKEIDQMKQWRQAWYNQ
ncbi:DUF305 domain-containing protein [[Phormidium ambiguum] IAM M-71]|uniref:DUF305 domain-containing protein n=1 Tax=[Phormidium ambiguum] IAM M-71 TaxID=454136 RepID=A0A1U7IGL4_9CYAN|nr:DUF305 domain-containing protein [Phormidium ambiguum]OKH36171.1 DUF305 domain-containing protein [Phormidium ambiguum IAM M-71]